MTAGYLEVSKRVIWFYTINMVGNGALLRRCEVADWLVECISDMLTAELFLGRAGPKC